MGYSAWQSKIDGVALPATTLRTHAFWLCWTAYLTLIANLGAYGGKAHRPMPSLYQTLVHDFISVCINADAE